MRSFALLAAIVACGYYFYTHRHPSSGDAGHKLERSSTAAAPTPALRYHSPLDAGNSRNSSGYYSTAPTARYEVSGPRSTNSGRATVERPQSMQPGNPAEP